MKIGTIAWKPTLTLHGRPLGPSLLIWFTVPELFKAHARVKAMRAAEKTKPIGLSVVFGGT